MKTVTDFIFLAPKSLQAVTAVMKLKMLAPWMKAMTNLDIVLKSRDITLPTKVWIVRAMVFPETMHGCESWDYQEDWVSKNTYFWTVVLEKTLENPLYCKEIKSVNPKGNQPWMFIGRTDAEVEVPILWPPDVKSWLTGKDLEAGKNWRQEKGTTENKMVGWHHGHELEQTPGDGEEQRSLMCCSPWGCKESDTAEWLTHTHSRNFSLLS